MPESVDRPAPVSTTTSPSATSPARSSRVPGPAAGRSTTAWSAVGTAVTPPWSPSSSTRAARSGVSDLAVQPAQQLLVHPAQAPGREGPLEEAADAAGAGPGGGGRDGGAHDGSRGDGAG